MDFQLQSAGGNAVDALTQLFAQQAALKRQAELDALNKENIESQIKDRETNRQIQEENAKALAEQRKAAAQKTAQDEFMKSAPLPGTVVTPALEDRAKAAGLSDLITTQGGATLPSKSTIGMMSMPGATPPPTAGPAAVTAQVPSVADASVPTFKMYNGTPQQQAQQKLAAHLDGSAPLDRKGVVSLLNQMGVPYNEIKSVADAYMNTDKDQPKGPANEIELLLDANNPTSPTAARSRAAYDDLIKGQAKLRNSGAAAEKASDDKSNAEEIANGIMDGTQPPTFQGMYRMTAPVRAILHENGFDLRTAQLDYNATQRFFNTANNQQQTRMRQNVNDASQSLDKIDELAQQWNGSGFPLLNKAALASAKQGLMGQQAKQIAIQLESQIADVTSELGNVYMGGNSPTDHGLQLAAQNLSADWDAATLKKATDLARQNLKYRMNSMNSMQPVTSKTVGGGAAGSSSADIYQGFNISPDGN